MDRELTDKELEQVTAGGVAPVETLSDELDVEQLDSVLGGVNQKVALDVAMQNPELFRKKALDALVEQQIQEEERIAQQENTYQGLSK